MATALDYSGGRPTGQAVADAQHVGVVRYIGTPGRGKNLTRAEFLDMDARGRGVATVYENHAADAAGGYAAGQTAARTARADADRIGLPSDQPIYFAVDSDQVTEAQFGAVAAYLDGAASIIGWAQVGVYGEYDVIEMAVGPHARLGWQTAAWSKGKRSAKAALYQRLGQIFVGGIECDVNDVQAADWGQHNHQSTTHRNTEDSTVQLKAKFDDKGTPVKTYGEIPVAGGKALRLAVSYGKSVTVHGVAGVYDTNHAPQKVPVATAFKLDADRPGPINGDLPAGLSHLVVEFTSPVDFTGWVS
jgi:hypothetical protein